MGWLIQTFICFTVIQLTAMGETALRAELDEVVEELNGKRDRNPYEYEIGSHNYSVAIDVTKNGNEMPKVMGQFCQAAMCAGYVVIGTYVNERSSNTRIFLGKADEYFNIEKEDIIIGGFGENGLDWATDIAERNGYNYGELESGRAVIWAFESEADGIKDDWSWERIETDDDRYDQLV
jgi:hypothetical protein